jgi:mRNA interferase YafQ
MRTIERSSIFKRDFKRELKEQYNSFMNTGLPDVIDALANDLALDRHYRDHKLLGEWKGYRECHMKPDLLLIYRKTEDNVLILSRLGSHSELFS